jgi:hypothetical protein
MTRRPTPQVRFNAETFTFEPQPRKEVSEMGKFLTSARTNQVLPKDIPNAREAAEKYADGTLFEADNGSKWRLRHARWVPVKERKPRATRRSARA